MQAADFGPLCEPSKTRNNDKTKEHNPQPNGNVFFFFKISFFRMPSNSSSYRFGHDKDQNLRNMSTKHNQNFQLLLVMWISPSVLAFKI